MFESMTTTTTLAFRIATDTITDPKAPLGYKVRAATHGPVRSRTLTHTPKVDVHDGDGEREFHRVAAAALAHKLREGASVRVRTSGLGRRGRLGMDWEVTA